MRHSIIATMVLYILQVIKCVHSRLSSDLQLYVRTTGRQLILSLFAFMETFQVYCKLLIKYSCHNFHVKNTLNKKNHYFFNIKSESESQMEYILIGCWFSKEDHNNQHYISPLWQKIIIPQLPHVNYGTSNVKRGHKTSRETSHISLGLTLELDLRGWGSNSK